MKVYVSENEIPNNCANCKQFNNYTCGLDKEDKYMKFLTQAPIQKNKYCPLESLEQHEAEIRKPLEEEIAKLKQDINDYKQRFKEANSLFKAITKQMEELKWL